MSDFFGPCSEPLCSEQAVRLFDCAHHCMKLVCLQHLIEHDQLTDHSQEYFHELQQLWTTYSLLVDETKLRFEFEQKLEKHRHLIQNVTNLLECDSINMEEYQSILEKLKQSIEQVNQDSSEPVLNLEQVINEPLNEISNPTECDSTNVTATRSMNSRFNNNEKPQTRKSMKNTLIPVKNYKYGSGHTTQNRNNPTINREPRPYRSLRRSRGECPLWFNGAFGLSKKYHGISLCPQGKYYEDFFRHLLKFHNFTLESTKKICQAIQDNEDPLRKQLFQRNDIVIDYINRFLCPFSIYNQTSPIKMKLTGHYCETKKRQSTHTLRYHLIHRHHMKVSDADKIICRL